MRLKIGDSTKPINLPGIDGSMFSLDSFKGRTHLISFYRFATCPFCNLRIHELVRRYAELSKEFSMVAVFDAELEDLKYPAEKHSAPFPILADKKNIAYRAYGIEHSYMGFVKGLLFRLPTLLKGMLIKGYWPNLFKGGLMTMPADFLVDNKGIIQVAYYGKDEGDHLSFDQIKEFSESKE